MCDFFNQIKCKAISGWDIIQRQLQWSLPVILTFCGCPFRNFLNVLWIRSINNIILKCILLLGFCVEQFAQVFLVYVLGRFNSYYLVFLVHGSWGFRCHRLSNVVQKLGQFFSVLRFVNFHSFRDNLQRSFFKGLFQCNSQVKHHRLFFLIKFFPLKLLNICL